MLKGPTACISCGHSPHHSDTAGATCGVQFLNATILPHVWQSCPCRSPPGASSKCACEGRVPSLRLHTEFCCEDAILCDDAVRCNLRDHLADGEDENGVFLYAWHCHKIQGHSRACSGHNDCGERSPLGSICGMDPDHEGAHAWEPTVLLKPNDPRSTMNLIPLLDNCRNQGTTNMLAGCLGQLNDGYLLVADETFRLDALNRGARKEQVITLADASTRGSDLKGAVLFIDPHAMRAMQTRLDTLTQQLAAADDLARHCDKLVHGVEDNGIAKVKSYHEDFKKGKAALQAYRVLRDHAATDAVQGSVAVSPAAAREAAFEASIRLIRELHATTYPNPPAAADDAVVDRLCDILEVYWYELTEDQQYALRIESENLNLAREGRPLLDRHPLLR